MLGISPRPAGFFMRALKFISMAIAAAFLLQIALAGPEDCPRDYIKIIVARHAQRPAGGDPSLSVLGRRQAKMLAERIKSIGFDGKIYVSPYLRTVETGVAVAKLLGTKVLLEPSIQERTRIPGIPDIKGRTQSEIEAMFPGFVSAVPKLKYPWVYDDNYGEILRKRVENFIKSAASGNLCDVLIITHKAGVDAAAGYLSEMSNTILKIPVWNCSMLYFIRKKDGKIEYVGSGVDFIPIKDVTNNFKEPLIGGLKEN